eukprot:276874-Amphidinium_carterae.1
MGCGRTLVQTFCKRTLGARNWRERRTLATFMLASSASTSECGNSLVLDPSHIQQPTLSSGTHEACIRA